MIGFWPAPNSGASSPRSSALETPTTFRSIVTQEAPTLVPEPLPIIDDDESLLSVDVAVDQPQSHEALGIEQPTGSDVLQVVRWVNSAVALGEPADTETVDDVAQRSSAAQF